MAAFKYPNTPHRRKHGPGGWRYERCRPWLRDEFSFRRVYCLRRERWLGSRRGTFEIDHGIPQVDRPGLRDEYGNLFYACASCNRLKQQHIVLDPCATALADHVEVELDGRIRFLTPDGQRFVRLLGLDDPSLQEFRRRLMETINASQEEFRRWMSYPEDLPDLTEPPQPPFNSRPDGVSQSCHARKQRGDLDEVY